MMTALAAAWTWLKVNVAALAEPPARWEALPPMYWGELLNPPEEE